MAVARARRKNEGGDKGPADQPGSAPGRQERSRTSRALYLLLRLAFYAAALYWHTSVWAWHFTEEARFLPGSRGFGWFFRYLTFCSYTCQLGALWLSATALTLTVGDPSHPRLLRAARRPAPWLATWADELCCVTFGLASVVTLMYYTLEAATKKMEEEGVVRPFWLGFSVHVLNSVTAWGDLFLGGKRSFSRRASRLSTALVAAYTLWILVCAHFNGRFPYPFLNTLPFPEGFLATAVAAMVLFYGVFKVGARISRRLQGLKALALGVAAQ